MINQDNVQVASKTREQHVGSQLHEKTSQESLSLSYQAIYYYMDLEIISLTIYSR